MRIVNSIIIDKSADEVWDVLGPRYADVSEWASGVYVSRARSDPPAVPGAPLHGRICETSVGPFKETITRYDPDAKVLAYRATGDKMPFFVRSLSNQWTMERLGGHKTRVTSTMTADLVFPFSLLLGWMLKRQFNRVIRESIEELKVFVETGHPHQRTRDAVLPARLVEAA